MLLVTMLIGICIILVWKNKIGSLDDNKRKEYTAPGIAITTTAILFLIVFIVYYIWKKNKKNRYYKWSEEIIEKNTNFNKVSKRLLVKDQ